MNYIQLIRSYIRFLAYALTHSFFSGMGQTIVIAFFVPYIKNEFQLSGTGFGSFYSAATFSATLLLPWAGKKIDDINLRHYSAIVGSILVLACLTLSLSPNLLILFIGMLMLRLSGQSLMGHISSTTMARYFQSLRGKALGISSLGHPLGEAFLSIVVAHLLILFGWRISWAILGGLCCLVFFPVTRLLVHKDDPFLHPAHTKENAEAADTRKQFTRKEVLKSPFFYFVLPAAVVPPFYATGFFLYHSNLAALKGWSLEWIATCVFGLAFFRIFGSFFIGPWIDKLGAKKLFPFHLIPMAFGLIALTLSNHPMIALFYLCMMGLSLGFEVSLKTALWAEVYGTKHLGAIRSMVMPIGIFTTAVAPILFGWFFEKGYDLRWLAWTAVSGIGLATILALAAPLPKTHPA